MGKHKFREHEGIKPGRQDQFKFDPRLLKVDPTYNVRDLTTPEARASLDVLKEQVRHAGVRDPLEVRLDGDDVVIVSGHRRHMVVMELIAEGVEIESVPVIHEPQGTGEIERTINLVLHNAGEPLKPMEVAQVVKRLVDFGWKHNDIAKRLGFKSAASVNHHLDLIAMPAEVQAAVKRGQVSASTARSAMAEIGPEETAKIIRDNAAQGKKTRPRDVPKTKVKAKTKAKPTTVAAPPPAEPKPEPSPPAASTTGTILNYRQYADEPKPPAPREALNGFYAAAEPFARSIELINLEEIADDQPVSVEITGADAKRFSRVWHEVTGEPS